MKIILVELWMLKEQCRQQEIAGGTRSCRLGGTRRRSLRILASSWHIYIGGKSSGSRLRTATEGLNQICWDEPGYWLTMMPPTSLVGVGLIPNIWLHFVDDGICLEQELKALADCISKSERVDWVTDMFKRWKILRQQHRASTSEQTKMERINLVERA